MKISRELPRNSFTAITQIINRSIDNNPGYERSSKVARGVL